MEGGSPQEIVISAYRDVMDYLGLTEYKELTDNIQSYLGLLKVERELILERFK